MDRSMEVITSEDLEHLAQLVDAEVDDFLCAEKWKPYRDRQLAVALCQGAALHFLDRRNGVKDFDVYVFFADLPGVKGPHNRSARKRDFGPSKFGQWSGDNTRFTGRRVDIFWRTISPAANNDPAAAIVAYLKSGKPENTPWHLSQKAVILLRPISLIGDVAWPPT